MENFEEIIKKLESKRKDSKSFQNKYQIRKMIELQKYYEGAEWAFTFALSLLKEKPEEY